jgi:hypothetical protein
MRGELFEFADGLRGRVRLLTNTADVTRWIGPVSRANIFSEKPESDQVDGTVLPAFRYHPCLFHQRRFATL